MIKYRTEKVIELNDWDQLVEKTYGRTYRFQQQDGCKDRGSEYITVPTENAEDYDFKNDSIPEVVNGDEMGVSFKAWLARDPKQPIPGQEYDWELSLFWQRNFYPAVEMVINDLHKKGLIEAGEYIIDIDW